MALWPLSEHPWDEPLSIIICGGAIAISLFILRYILIRMMI